MSKLEAGPMDRLNELRALGGVLPAGWVCVAASLLGLGSAVLMIGVEPAVGVDHFRYPFTPTAFAVAQVWFFVQHLGLLAGLYGLSRSGAVGTGRLGRLGALGAIVGMAMLSVTELVAISGSDSVYPSARTDMIGTLYGISSILIGMTLIMAGTAVIRTGRWRGWTRYVPLALGVYVFVPLIPALFGTYAVARLGIAGWMLGFAFLGWALIRSAREDAIGAASSHPPRS